MDTFLLVNFIVMLNHFNICFYWLSYDVYENIKIKTKTHGIVDIKLSK